MFLHESIKCLIFDIGHGVKSSSKYILAENRETNINIFID
jgi:hypothetical protein